MPDESTIIGSDLTRYKDIPYQGFQRAQVAQITGVESLKNALKLYLFSNKGDYGRDIERGGPTIKFIGLPLNEASRSFIHEELRNSLSVYRNIIISEINVTPVPEEKKWKIYIVFSDTINKLVSNIGFTLQG